MSIQITTAFVEQYGANIQMLSQQKGSRLRRAIAEESVTHVPGIECYLCLRNGAHPGKTRTKYFPGF